MFDVMCCVQCPLFMMLMLCEVVVDARLRDYSVYTGALGRVERASGEERCKRTGPAAAAAGQQRRESGLPPWWGACAGVIRLLRKAPDKHGHPEHILSREERKAPVIGGQPWPTP